MAQQKQLQEELARAKEQLVHEQQQQQQKDDNAKHEEWQREQQRQWEQQQEQDARSSVAAAAAAEAELESLVSFACLACYRTRLAAVGFSLLVILALGWTTASVRV